MQKYKILLILAATFLLTRPAAAADETARSYLYKNIETDIAINQDTTFDVTEKQTYSFQGEYHKGWRSIPYNKIDGITDVRIFDGATGLPLAWAGSSLDKTDPKSWGKYYTSYSGGNLNIEWYYNLKDTEHTWIIKYKVWGALTFNKTNDQLYWNIFTNYEVPVKEATVSLFLPQKFTADQLHIYAYRGDTSKITTSSYNPQNGGIKFYARDFYPLEAFTVDLDWPLGAVNRQAYWLGWFKMHYGYVGSAVILILSFLFGFIFWLKKEIFVTGRGTIVPEYEPPQGLSPAMAEIVLKENISGRGVSATIIDLAVRGYVRIEEKIKENFFTTLAKKLFITLKPLLGIFAALAIFTAIYLISHRMAGLGIADILSIFGGFLANSIFYLVPLVILLAIGRAVLGGKDYHLYKLRDFSMDPAVRGYEKNLLASLFFDNDEFSTRAILTAPQSTKRRLYEESQRMKEKSLVETAEQTGAFEKPPAKEKYKTVIWLFLLFGSMVFWGSIPAMPQYAILFLGALIAGTGLWAFVNFETRLNQSGRELKEKILGFKMFLYTAERYRLQNLTPEMFQAFLPYAMVFKIEKKWAKAFEQMQLPAPGWYAATVAGTHSAASAASVSSFSPSAFSASFVSSFSSAISSSGASGGGAGGCGAGGGGGGGGGGAS